MIEPGKPFVLGGREFRLVEHSTTRRRWWLTGLIERAGIANREQQEGEDADRYARRLLMEFMDLPEAFLIIGGCIVYADKADRDWTPAMAKEIADFLSELTASEDHQTLQTFALSMVSGFFESGIDLSQISRTFSQIEPVPTARNAGQSTSESGQQSSRRSPDSILRRWTRLLTGRFERRYSRT